MSHEFTHKHTWECDFRAKSLTVREGKRVGPMGVVKGPYLYVVKSGRGRGRKGGGGGGGGGGGFEKKFRC